MREITERLRTAYEAAKYVPGDCPVVPVKIDRFMKEVGSILAALAADAKGGGPVVKPLEWRDRHKQDNRYGDLVVDSVVGQYVIRPSANGTSFRLWMPDTKYNDALVFDSPESAKAAAQKDFEARILSALEVSNAR